MDYRDFLEDLELSYKTETFSSNFDTEVLWFPENSTLFIRGTDSLLDWIFNLLFFKKKGYHFGWRLKSKFLLKNLKKHGIVPTTVVGHSKGGAIAQYLGFTYNCEAYALACPKTVDKESIHPDFLSWADSNLVIINQANDFLSKLPPNLTHPIEPLVLDTKDYGLYAHLLVSFE